MEVTSLYHHMKLPNGTVMTHTHGVNTGKGGPETCAISFPRVLKLVVCPVDGFPERAHNPGRLREHFMYRHWKLNMEILQ